MNIIEAIAKSPCNKAQAHNDEGHLVIVEERWGFSSVAPFHKLWWHVWAATSNNNWITLDIGIGDSEVTKQLHVDWQADYWSSVR